MIWYLDSHPGGPGFPELIACPCTGATLPMEFRLPMRLTPALTGTW